MSPALAGRFLTTGPPGKSNVNILNTPEYALNGKFCYMCFIMIFFKKLLHKKQKVISDCF